MNNDPTSKDADDSQTQWLTFTLGNESYGVEVLHVQEVLRCPEISPVPGAPVHLLGIISLRGEVIAVSDMRVMLGLPVAEVSDQTRIVLMELDGQKQGMLVDSVTEIIDVKASEMEAITMTGERSQTIQGICRKKDKLYLLLSINELMKDDGDV